MDLPRKRNVLVSAGSARLPLKETNGNIPTHRGKPYKQPIQQVGTTTATAAGSAVVGEGGGSRSRTTTLVGAELLEWQTSWRRIMKELTAYFDTQGCDLSNSSQIVEQKRAHRALKMVGCAISPFFEREVTIIISRRPFNAAKEYPTSDIFHDAVNQRIKVWNYDKVFRFLKNIGAFDNNNNSNNAGNNGNGELYNLLKEEKIFGNNDRDPNARRDDLHYFDKNYLYSYDLTQTIRPIAIREWQDKSYPNLSLTLDGKCPFIADHTPLSEQNLERRKIRRIQKFEATKGYRDLLKEATRRIICETTKREHSFMVGTSTDRDQDEDEVESEAEELDVDEVDAEAEAQEQAEVEEGEVVAPVTLNNNTLSVTEAAVTDASGNTSGQTATGVTKYLFKAPPAPLLRQSSVMQPNDSNSRYYEVAASGFNGASNAAQCSMDSSLNSNNTNHNNNNNNNTNMAGNGLGPSFSQVPSKNINNLKRRIFMKKQKEKKLLNGHQISNSKDKELKPGYCENCRVKYDHFDDHIKSNRHKTFACDDLNFKDIDELISTLNETKSLGYITSNGEYSTTK